MRKLFGILSALAVSITLAAQEPTSSTFGLSPSDEAFVKQMRHRMDSIRKHRPTVALVLSGGGAKGAATIGAMQYIKRYNFPIDIVAGTSIGGLIGSLYAMGYDEDYLDTLIHNMDWGKALSDKVDKSYIPYYRRRYKEKFLLSIPFYYRPDDYASFLKGDASMSDGLSKKFRLGANNGGTGADDVKNQFLGSLPSGFVYGQNVNQVITSRTVGYSDSLDFSKFPIPVICVATDVVSSKAKIWHSGSINYAMRSTMSIPGLFVPVRTDGMVLIDGGMRNNYPANLVRKLGADIVIGIDLANESLDSDKIQNLGDILMQSIDMFANDSREYNLPLIDVSIHPDLKDYNMLSFNKEAVDAMYWIGFKAAAAMAPQLDSLRKKIGKEKFRLSAPPAKDINKDPVVIDAIEVVGVPEKEAHYIRSRMYIKPGSIVNARIIEDEVSRIFGKGAYEYVNYELHGDKEPYTLKIICKRGPMHQFGVGLRLDSETIVGILLNVGLNTHAMSGHSLDFTARISTNPYADLHYAYNAPVFATYNARAFFRYTGRPFLGGGVQNVNMSFIYGIQELYVSNMKWSKLDIHVGLQNHFFKIRNILYETPGDYAFDLNLKDYPGAFVTGRVETLDNGYFPTKGVSAGFRAELVGRFFYPNEKPVFGVIQADGMIPLTVGRITIIPQANLRLLLGEDIPLLYANIMGGDTAGRYIDQQIPFIGLGTLAFRRNCLAVARLDARMNLWKNHYVSVLGNVSYDFVNFKEFLGGDINGGVGLSYAYNSIFGPLKLQLHWSTLTNAFGAYLSMGYNF